MVNINVKLGKTDIQSVEVAETITLNQLIKLTNTLVNYANLKNGKRKWKQRKDEY